MEKAVVKVTFESAPGVWTIKYFPTYAAATSFITAMHGVLRGILVA
jgi:hypothetical protein